MSNLKDIVYCTEEQLKTMSSGTPVSGHEYDENDLYITPLDDDIIVGADGSGTKVNDNNELVVDPTYIHDTVDTDIADAKTIAERAEVIAKGRATAYIYNTVEELEAALADEEFVASLVVGDNFYIRALEVPDYWWDGESKQELETEKPDLTDIVKDVTIDGKSIVGEDGIAVMPHASESNLGVVGVNSYWGITIHANGNLRINSAKASDINSRNSFMPITPSVMEYAVMEALSNTMADIWTEDRMAAARTRLGSVSADEVSTMINEALGVLENGYY